MFDATTSEEMNIDLQAKEREIQKVNEINCLLSIWTFQFDCGLIDLNLMELMELYKR